ncbi:MAG: hypothetical protein ChlgKO_08860 [Chlamydiales bacterium]
MIEYPLKFQAISKMNGSWSAIAHEQPPLNCAIPPQFGGPGDGFSPEDFFGMAIMSCFMGSFKVFAKKSALTFTELEGSVEISVDRNEQKSVSITQVDLQFSLRGAADVDKARAILEEAKNNCIVANSINSIINFTFAIND